MSNTRASEDEKKNQKGTTLSIQKKLEIDTVSGLLTGTFCSGVFNPWDRALYLSVTHKRAFLSWSNFSSPYHGFLQAVTQRAFLGSVYYIAQGELKNNMHPYLREQLHLSESTTQFCIGTTAGSINGLLTNWLSAVKYHAWSDKNHTFISSFNDMLSRGRYRTFMKGTFATMLRDTTFGGIYEVTRHLMRTYIPKPKDISADQNGREPQAVSSQLEFFSNSTAAGIAAIASGPFNYVRSVQYGTPPDKTPPNTWQALKDVWQESKDHIDKKFGKLRFFQERFRVGWGTARVSVGMAVGQKVFDMTRKKLTDHYKEPGSTVKPKT